MGKSILSISLSILFMAVGVSNITATEIDKKVAYYADKTIHDGIHDYPVIEVIRDWNNNPRVFLRRISDCSRIKNPNVACVTINEYLYPKGYDAGAVFWNNTNKANEANIGLNSRIKFNYRERRMAICHELGHFLRLGHSINDSTKSCMRYYIKPDPNIHPTGKDLLNVRYPARYPAR